MAREGARFTDFHSANAVCSPSRAALLTGRYPTRVGIPRVLVPNDTLGIDGSETTLPEVLKPSGYRSYCIGKWHLGTQTQFLPTNRGFGEFYGVPYSHDMSPLPLMHNCEVVQPAMDVSNLTQLYTQQALRCIMQSQDTPFFLYLAHSAPHEPLFASQRFRGRSRRGLYGDTVMEMDWSVGQILHAIHSSGLDQNTLVMLSSDHGPWYEGSAGRLRGRKGETYEGGFRVPLIARMPGSIPKGTVSRGMATMMDILPTAAGLAGASLPPLPLDGVNIWPQLTGQTDAVERDVFLYFDTWNLQCARLGPWKLHISRYNTPPYVPEPADGRQNLPLANPELYNVDENPEESYNLAADNPDVVKQILDRVNSLLPTFPSEVQTAWQQTMSRATGPAYPGAWPVCKT